jgi:hypothetical protein
MSVDGLITVWLGWSTDKSFHSLLNDSNAAFNVASRLAARRHSEERRLVFITNISRMTLSILAIIIMTLSNYMTPIIMTLTTTRLSIIKYSAFCNLA